MSNTLRIEIENINDQNFELWKLKMEDLLIDREQWVTIDPRTKSISMSNEDWMILDINLDVLFDFVLQIQYY